LKYLSKERMVISKKREQKKGEKRKKEKKRFVSPLV
jgi:hypothetical protein